MDVSIEQATVSDAEAILALQRLAYQSEAAIYDDFTLPPLTESLDQLLVLFGSHTFLKAVTENRLVGSVRGVACDSCCQIGRLIVHPDWRRCGLGTRLMGVLETRFPHVERFELFTGHRSAGPLQLYEKLGYARTKTVVVHERLRLVYLEKRREVRAKEKTATNSAPENTRSPR